MSLDSAFAARLIVLIGTVVVFLGPLVVGEAVVRLYCWARGWEFRE